MLPRTLALVDDDPVYSEYLAQHLGHKGVQVTRYADGNSLLADTAAEYDFFIIDLMLPGVDGEQLLDIVRRRSDAGVLVVSGRLGPEVFSNVLRAGADMYLAKPVQFEQVEHAIEAVYRRSARVAGATGPWRLDRRARTLAAPDGAQIALADSDFVVLERFLGAQGEPVSRDELLTALGRPNAGPEGADVLNAVMYRLRRRIERATPMLVPLQARSRVGYVFRATLTEV
ncbi:MAG: response regulator transcription factor [Rubrivivax sp.]|nr:response regulator transcription factor [Rubrivivax sp.]